MTTLALLGRLAVVFALLALVLWLLRRTGGLGVRRAAALQVLSTTRLGKTASLSVVRVHDEEYVLGVSGSGMTVVSSRPATTEPAPAAPAAPVTPAAAPVPPTPAQFLRAGWSVLRSRPVETSEVDEQDLSAALARALEPAALPTAPSVPAASFAAELAGALSATLGEPPPAETAQPVVRTAALVPAQTARTDEDLLSSTAADGSAAAPAGRAPLRPRYRTDALAREELIPWSRTSRPTAASEGAGVGV